MAIEVHIKKNLDGFCLSIDFETKDSRLGLLGASGCGKSMTLKAIAGILTPDEGRIVVNGTVFFDKEKKINLSAQERKIGYLFQNYALFPTMTVEKNIASGLHDLKKNDKKVIIKKMIERFALSGLEKRYPYELSGGQQQRVALARIFAYEPSLIMLDEPFSALDGFLKDSMKHELKNFLSEYNGDLIIVSHSRDEIYSLSNQLITMEKGNLVENGYTKDVFDRPAFEITAKLTGCKNISKIEKINENHIFAIDWGIPLEVNELVNDDIKYIGVRAHDILINGEDTLNKFDFIIEDIIDAPFENQFVVKKSNYDKKSRIWWQGPKSPSTSIHTTNSTITLSFPKEKLLLLK